MQILQSKCKLCKHDVGCVGRLTCTICVWWKPLMWFRLLTQSDCHLCWCGKQKLHDYFISLVFVQPIIWGHFPRNTPNIPWLSWILCRKCDTRYLVNYWSFYSNIKHQIYPPRAYRLPSIIINFVFSVLLNQIIFLFLLIVWMINLGKKQTIASHLVELETKMANGIGKKWTKKSRKDKK